MNALGNAKMVTHSRRSLWSKTLSLAGIVCQTGTCQKSGGVYISPITHSLVQRQKEREGESTKGTHAP